jgi:hypothetical protein
VVAVRAGQRKSNDGDGGGREHQPPRDDPHQGTLIATRVGIEGQGMLSRFFWRA